MALTINTHPVEVITNAPEFNVTTSLTESASIQNLRIRATTYIGGQTAAVSVLEQLMGLDEWDFFDHLKSFIGKCNHTVGTTDEFSKPVMGSELLTGWTNFLSTFETFTSSGREITSAIDSNASGGVALGNDMGAFSPGDILIGALQNDWADVGVQDVQLGLSGNVGLDLQSTAKYAGRSSGKLKKNHIFPLMVHDVLTTSFFTLSTSSGANCQFSGTGSIHAITNFRNNPCVYFHVKFEEVYENASNVTTIGDEEWADTLLFAPVALRPEESFDDYLSDGLGGKLLIRSYDHPSTATYVSETKYKIGIDMEYRMIGLSVCPFVSEQVFYGSNFNAAQIMVNAGWWMTLLNDSLGIVEADGYYYVIHYSVLDEAGSSGITVMNAMYVYLDTGCRPDVKTISFVGDLGEETIIFKGLPSEKGMADKSFYRDQKRIRKVLKSYKRKQMMLRTVYETKEVRRLLYELINTELPVWMYDAHFTAGYRDVTVITDEADIEDQNELYETEIDVEYYE